MDGDVFGLPSHVPRKYRRPRFRLAGNEDDIVLVAGLPIRKCALRHRSIFHANAIVEEGRVEGFAM